MPLPEDAFDNERYRRGGTDSEALDPITRVTSTGNPSQPGPRCAGGATSWPPSSSVRPSRRSCAPIPPSSPRPTSPGASSPAWPRTCCRPRQPPSSARKSAATWSAPSALTHRHPRPDAREYPFVAGRRRRDDLSGVSARHRLAVGVLPGRRVGQVRNRNVPPPRRLPAQPSTPQQPRRLSHYARGP